METPEEILVRGVREGLHLGAQLCVAHQGAIVIDFACGEARTGVAMTSESLTQWYSAGKPLTAVLLAMLHQRQGLDFSTPVSDLLPEFGQNGKAAVTIQHLLTHTAGFRSADRIPPLTPWAEMIRLICEAPLEAGWLPGEKAGYSTQASWYILAEIVQRLSGAPFDEYIRRELLLPLGMNDSWLRLPFAAGRTCQDRLSVMYNTANGRREPLPLQDAEGMAVCRPGASARGPVRELARFYSMLLADGELSGASILRPATVSALTARHRTGLFDQTFMHQLDFGLGFILDSNRYGADTVPYGYGLHCSEETFGHSGAQSSCAFADPRHRLVAAWVANGQPGDRAHQTRQRELNTAIYRHVGLGNG